MTRAQSHDACGDRGASLADETMDPRGLRTRRDFRAPGWRFLLVVTSVSPRSAMAAVQTPKDAARTIYHLVVLPKRRE